MNLILLGPPGSGKGTQAKLLAKKFNLEHISSGALLRQEALKNTPKAKKLRTILTQGELVPFDTVLSLVLPKIKNSPQGFVLDGIPRNLAQAEHLNWVFKENNIPIPTVILFTLTDAASKKRLLLRARKENRSDDQANVIVARLKIYYQQTQPIVSYYNSLHYPLIKINAAPKIQTIFKNIVQKLDNIHE